jgi:hypothetical protein
LKVDAPDISDKRGQPDGPNITQRPFHEPGLPEPPHPQEESEAEPQSRLDNNQECVKNAPETDRGIRQLQPSPTTHASPNKILIFFFLKKKLTTFVSR